MTNFSQFLILFLISIKSIVNSENSSLFAEDTLKHSHGNIIYSSVIFRHGERSPYTQYPTDPYQDESYWRTYWPQGKGQLSKKGKLQEYNLGKWFRKRYDFLIKEGYRYDLLKMHSSDLDRTIMSAECFLAGFLPPSSNEMWTDDGLRWQPVPIRAIPIKLDVMIGFWVECKTHELEKEKLNRSPEMKEFYKKYNKVFNYIARNSGIKMSSNNILKAIVDVYSLYDVLFIEESNNLTLPAWTNSIYPEPLKSIGVLFLSNMAHSRQMRRIKAGTLIGKIIEEMELKIQDKLTETFHFYSGHDSTIVGFLKALEMFDGIMPPYSASVLIELRQKNKDYLVTISYRNSTNSAPQLLQVPGCGHICTLKDFKKLTEYLVPDDWQDECGNHDRQKKFGQKEHGMKWPKNKN